ncbi:hypothetical protein M404DRAFT_33330 [Pisolithus tinctorius Marx 270]|uniref:Uncharacterized protein n=1 Tax=Pisolithus tinctorius Marx 270 TaxID=870435 RepID=A0A0C3IH75_PISTI|nr:hypothetical protein M404DRAFT_33330 [Pisolithus tinctorius Marx 270]
MSDLRPTSVLDDAIRYDTDNEEEHEEQVWLEAERVAREQAEAERAEQERVEAERIAQEAEEKRACKEEEKCKAEEEKEAERKCKAKTGKSSEARGEVKRVVMDPGCTRCTWANTICEFLVDGNKKWVACIQCNQSKGKCRWPGDGKDAEAGSKAKANKGKKWKADEEMPEPGPSQKKRAKSKVVEVLEIDEPEAGGSGLREASAERYSGLENKLKRLIEAMGLIANNLASLFELHETAVENSGCIANTLESLLDKSYGYGMAVSPLDLGSSELDSNELHKEAEWLRTHSKDNEEETKGEDEAMAEGK